MIFTVLFVSDAGVPLESKTEDPAFRHALLGKQTFYIVSTALDGPMVCKFGISQDAARRGWNIQRLRQYLKAYGAYDNGATSRRKSGPKSTGRDKSCHGAKLHFLATTSYEPRSGRMVADRYRQSTLVRLETYLKRFYAKRPESLKNSLRGDERVRVRPAMLIRQVLDLKTLLPNQVDAASGRRRRSRRIQARARVATPSKKLYEIARSVGDRPWQYQIKWKGYAAPTWEPKQVLRHDLGDAQYEALVRAFHADELDGNDGGKEVGKQHKQRRKRGRKHSPQQSTKRRMQPRRSPRLRAKRMEANRSAPRYEIARIVGDRPWEFQIEWKGYAQPTWEPKRVLRLDLGRDSYEELVRDFEAHHRRSRRGRRRG